MALLNILVANPELSLLVRGDQRVTICLNCLQLSQDCTVSTAIAIFAIATQNFVGDTAISYQNL